MKEVTRIHYIKMMMEESSRATPASLSSTCAISLHHHNYLVRNFSSHIFVLCHTTQAVLFILVLAHLITNQYALLSCLSQLCVHAWLPNWKHVEIYRINHFGLPSPFFYFGFHDNFLFWFSLFTTLQTPCRCRFCHTFLDMAILSLLVFSFYFFKLLSRLSCQSQWLLKS